MITFNTIDPKELASSSNSILSGKKLVLSNFYGIDNEDDCGIYLGENTVITRIREHNFYRIFVQSADLEETQFLLQNLDGNRYAINIPSKTPIPLWCEILKGSGFEDIGTYHRYYTTKVKFRSSACGEYAVIEDIESIDHILKANFSLYTDHLPSLKQLREMISSKQVFVSRGTSGEVEGILIYTLQGRKCYINAWIDFSGKGLFLLYKAYNIAVEHGIQYVYFWVNSTNDSVIRLHQMMGAKHDGLIDYNFLKTVND